ncbi:MAG: NAD(P)-dependent alcohol dehydrogenase [Syntrophaceae bacterium]|jgi:aryl-alcohol dehydrogenase|nr:NAD(P)-dependent alcohol dehydrogenase [Syntrophaceae bacterium]
MKISAAVLREKGQPFLQEELDLDEPRPDEILVRIAAAGICHTDVTVRNNPLVLPVVLGHEGAGIVEKVGNGVTKVQPGDPVVLSYVYCGRCANCRQGRPAYCSQSAMATFGGVRADGTTTLSRNGEKIFGNFFGQSSFATHALTYENNVVKVRPDAPLALLGPLGCGIQTGAGAVINSLQVKAGASIAVFGLGAVGLSAVMAAKICGCFPIIGVDIQPHRLELARDLGATHVLDAAQENPTAEIKKITGDGADYALECAGNPKVLRQALESVRRPGVCGLVGGAPLGTEATFDMNSIMFGRTVRGILEGDSVPDIFIPQLVDFVMQGRLPLEKLVTFYDFDRINQAVEDSGEGRTIKPILRMPA